MPAISLNSKDGGRFKALLGGKPQLVDGQRLTFPVRDEIKARQFLRSLNPTELAKLERYIAKSQLNGTSDSNALVSKLCSQQLVIYQIGGTEQSAVDSDAIEALRSQIKQQLGLIINQERLEAARIEAEQQRRSDLGKAAVYVGKFAQGLGEGAWSLLTWVKEINDVVSIQQRLHRTVSAAWQSYDDDPGQWVKKFSREMAQREHRELVEALGFDPTKISREMLAQAYEVANLIWEDAATQQILLDFTKSYAAAQHSLEWTQMAGGAAFEIILTAVLAAFTGGVGAVASLGSKARWLKPLAKLGELFQDLAKLLKKVRRRKLTKKSKPGGSKIDDYVAEGKAPDTSEPPKGKPKADSDKPLDDDKRVSSKPDWLRRVEEGNDFNKRQAANYPNNEVYVNKPDGDGYFRLDSYNPNTGEIVSRKHTQLSDIQESTAVNYINEIQKKYPVGAKIADVPTNVQNGLAGQRLQGQYILEVPVQKNPVPQSVIDAANDAGVLIRDINGTVY